MFSCFNSQWRTGPLWIYQTGSAVKALVPFAGQREVHNAQGGGQVWAGGVGLIGHRWVFTRFTRFLHARQFNGTCVLNAMAEAEAGSLNLVCSDEQNNGCTTKWSSLFCFDTVCGLASWRCLLSCKPVAGQWCHVITFGFVQVISNKLEEIPWAE